MSSKTFDPLSLADLAMPENELAMLGRHWGWILATGVLYILLGVFALMMPVASTLGLTIGLGAVLIVAGLVQLVQAIRLRRRHGMALRFFQSVLAIVSGGLMLRYPGGGMMSIALLLSFYFFIGAATQWIYYSAAKPFRGRGWVLASSILTFMLGVYILMTFPFSALWVPGTLLGIDLVATGAATIGLSLTVRKTRAESGRETAGKWEQSAATPSPQPT